MKTKLTFRIIAFLLCLASVSATKAQNVGINTDAPHNDAILEIYADSKGVLIPRVSTFERDNSLDPTAAGMLIFNADSNRFNYYNGTEWVDLSGGWEHKVNGTAASNFVHAALGAGERVGIGTASPSTKLEVVGSTTMDDLTATTYNQKVGNAVVSGGIVPQGGIIMWSGTTAPDGWALCDGNGGRPNLKGRFVVGYDPAVVAYDATGKTGGAASVTLTKAQLPKHKHKADADGGDISINNSGAHSHTIDRAGPPGIDAIFAYDKTNFLLRSEINEAVAGDGSHTHNNGTFDGSVGDGTTDGLNGQAHENRPPYYVLAYIIKL